MEFIKKKQNDNRSESSGVCIVICNNTSTTTYASGTVSISILQKNYYFFVFHEIIILFFRWNVKMGIFWFCFLFYLKYLVFFHVGLKRKTWFFFILHETNLVCSKFLPKQTFPEFRFGNREFQYQRKAHSRNSRNKNSAEFRGIPGNRIPASNPKYMLLAWTMNK